jgi:hypothetical protein
MADPGWPWPQDDAAPAAGPDADPDLLAAACARLFAGADGHLLLDHLCRLTLGTSPGPTVSEARLRHLEGQRALVLYLRHLARRGGLSPLPLLA